MSLGDEHIVKSIFFPRQWRRRTGGRRRTAVDLSAIGAKGARLASVRVSARVMRNTIADPRGGGRNGIGGGGWNTTGMARARLSVSLFCVCVVAVALFALRALAVVLPTRVAGAVLLIFLVMISVRSRGFVVAAVSYHLLLPTSERLAVVAEMFEVGVENVAIVSGGASTLTEGMCAS